MKKDLESHPKEANMIAFEFARDYGSCSQLRIKALQGIFRKIALNYSLLQGSLRVVGHYISTTPTQFPRSTKQIGG